MPEPLRTLSRTLWARWCLRVVAVALLCLGTARVPLEDAPEVQSLARELAQRLGAEVEFGAVRVDPLGAGGVVVTDLHIDGGGWRLSLPRAVWRPRMGAWLRAEAGGVIRASRFHLEIDAEISDFAIPDLDVRLEGGRASVTGYGPVLESMRLATRGSGPDRRVEVEGRQAGTGTGVAPGPGPNSGPGRGRLDLRIRNAANGERVVDVFPENFAVASLPVAWVRRLARAGAPSVTAVGHWRASLAPSGDARHEFDLALRSVFGRRADLRARGHWVTRAAPTGPRFGEGSWLELDGRLRHEAAGIRISGPLHARWDLAGAVADPWHHLALRLDDANLRVGDRVRKPTGLPARLDLTRDPAADRTQLAIELGALRARAERHGAGAFHGESDWLALSDAAPWLEGLGADADGRARLAAFRVAGAEDYTLEFDLDRAQAAGPELPLALTGRLEVDARGFRARGIAAELAGVALQLDVEGRHRHAAQPLELDLHARAGTLRLGASNALEWAATDSLGALAAAASAPLLRLHDARGRLAGVTLHSGRFEAARVQVGGRVVRDLEVDLALRALRLDVSRLAFRSAAGPERYAGSVDFNPLLPAVEFAAAP